MSTYVADKRLKWARGLPVFIALWCVSVCPVCLSQLSTAALACGRLLWARLEAEDIDRLLHGLRSAATAPQQHGSRQQKEQCHVNTAAVEG